MNTIPIQPKTTVGTHPSHHWLQMVLRHSRGLSSSLIMSLCFISPMVEQAQAISFTFTKIADNRSGPFSDAFFFMPMGEGTFVSPPTINDAGTVAFHAVLDLDTSSEGIFTGTGGETTLIADTSGSYSGFGEAESPINSQGTVAFGAGFDTGGEGVFTSSNGKITQIASSDASSVQSPAINDAGTVAFIDTDFDTGSGIFTSNGGKVTTIVDSSGPFNFVSDPAINNVGTVAFQASLDTGEGGIFTRNGGETTTIADTNGAFNTLFNSVINNTGTVAFQVSLDTGGDGIFTGNRGETTLIADDSGPFTDVTGPAINDVGTVAFKALLNPTPIKPDEGIFTGSDPVEDKVIATGDSLLGSTVTEVYFGNNGLNNAGQITFIAGLADGTQGVFRAKPVPEPALGLGSLVGAGVFAALRLRKRGKH